MKELIERIKSLNILVVGDVMLDRYIIGEVSRISPEAPVPVLKVVKNILLRVWQLMLPWLRSLGSSVECGLVWSRRKRIRISANSPRCRCAS